MDAILCAIDFSPATAPVIGSGAGLAKALGARLIAFHAVHFASDPLYATDFADRRARTRRLCAAAGDRLAECMAGVDQPWEPVVVRGDPVEQLAHLVAERRPRLVVTASHGIGMIQRLFTGTVVERMVRQVRCPILILHPPGQLPEDCAVPLRRVLVGCDLQPPAVPLEAACGLLGHCAAEIHLLHVSESPLDPALVEIEHGPAGQKFENLGRSIDRRLEAACSKARAAGLHLEAKIRPGVPAEVLREYARERQIDLTVVGVHRTGAFKRALIGSTARDLLRDAPCSLLTIPQPDGAAGGGT